MKFRNFFIFLFFTNKLLFENQQEEQLTLTPTNQGNDFEEETAKGLDDDEYLP